jgi:uncharacterized repeat protein (TIGR01451 family)
MTHSWRWRWLLIALFVFVLSALPAAGASITRMNAASSPPSTEGTGRAVSEPGYVNVRALPTAAPGAERQTPETEHYPIPAAIVARQRAAALLQPPGTGIQIASPPLLAGGAGGGLAPTLGAVAFDAVAASESNCSGCLPPDGDVAVGPNHVIGLANTAFEIYDRSGTRLAGPVGFPGFFYPVSCNPWSFFGAYSDPFGGYDPAADRYVVGILAFSLLTYDSNICIGVTQTGDPTGGWNVYAFPVLSPAGNNLLDYPQMAIWHDAVYVAGNRFDMAGQFLGARVVAYNKAQMYGGQTATQVWQAVGNGASGGAADTLHPTWPHGGQPTSGPIYFIAQDWCLEAICDTISLWRWSDPFGTSTWTLAGGVHVTPYHQVINPAPAPGGTIAANDWRNQDAHLAIVGGVRTIYGVHAISCNPNDIPVNCIQWYQLGNVDGAPTLVQQGILAGYRSHRMYPDLTVDAQGDLLLGYAYWSNTDFAGIRYTGRLAIDPPNTLQAESVMKAGEIGGVDGRRWGDYAGMVTDPVDGCTAWHLEEYARSGELWSTWIGTAYFSACKGLALSKLDSDGDNPLLPGAALAYTITVQNTGGALQSGILVSDTLPSCMSVTTSSCTGTGGAGNCTLLPPVPGVKTTIVNGGTLNSGQGWRINYSVNTSACPLPSTQTNTAFVRSATLAEHSSSTVTDFRNPPVTCFSDGAGDFGNFNHTAAVAAHDDWQVTNATGDPPPAFFANDPAYAADKSLFMNAAIPVAASGTILLFDQRYSFQYTVDQFFGYYYFWDGAVLEGSTDGGLTWTPINTTSFLLGGYTGTLEAGTNNPLTGRPAWAGPNMSWSPVAVDLSAQFANQNVLIRWRLGSDDTYGDQGWWIDNVRVHDCAGTRDVLSGFVYADCNLNGQRDVALVEKGLSSVQLQIAGDASGTATTNSAGFWQFVPGVNGANYSVQLNPASLPFGNVQGAPNNWNIANGNTCPPGFADPTTYWAWGEHGGWLNLTGVIGVSAQTRLGMLGNGTSPVVVGTPTPTGTAGPTATPSRTPTATNTPLPPTSTNTPAPTATATRTNTPLPPTSTNTPGPTPTATRTNTPLPPTNTNTPGPSPTPTATATRTNTPLPPTGTSTPAPTSTGTSVPPTSTGTLLPASATATATACPGLDTYIVAQSLGGTITPGTIDIGNHCDDCTSVVALPFPVTFYDQTFSSALVSSNGRLAFVSTDASPANVCLPDGASSNAIMAFWDDLRTDGTGQGVFVATLGTAPARTYVIEWRALHPANGATYNFAVYLHENAPDFEIIYGTINDEGVSATVGVQKDAGARYTEWLCNGVPRLLGQPQQLSFTRVCGAPATATATAAPPTVTATATATPTGTAGTYRIFLPAIFRNAP